MKYKAGNTTNKFNFMFPELVFLDKKCDGDDGLMITQLYFIVWTLPEWYVLFSSQDAVLSYRFWFYDNLSTIDSLVYFQLYNYVTCDHYE